MKSTTHVLFIQGAGTGSYKEDEKLMSDLRQNLGPQYIVHYPAMEGEEDADYDTWARQIESEVDKMDPPIILVGHSVGASIIIKLLSERELQKTIGGVFLIAAPFWGGRKGWTFEGYETLELPPDVSLNVNEEVPIFFYHSRDDRTVPFAHVAYYAQVIPRARIREFEGRGHQLNNDLSEVADDIKKIGLGSI